MGNKEIKQEITKKLEKIKMKEDEITNLISDIEGKIDEINGEKPKPFTTGYGTSCLQIQTGKGKLIDEY
jgi:hypothetical protein